MLAREHQKTMDTDLTIFQKCLISSRKYTLCYFVVSKSHRDVNPILGISRGVSHDLDLVLIFKLFMFND